MSELDAEIKKASHIRVMGGAKGDNHFFRREKYCFRVKG